MIAAPDRTPGIGCVRMASRFIFVFFSLFYDLLCAFVRGSGKVVQFFGVGKSSRPLSSALPPSSLPSKLSSVSARCALK